MPIQGVLTPWSKKPELASFFKRDSKRTHVQTQTHFGLTYQRIGPDSGTRLYRWPSLLLAKHSSTSNLITFNVGLHIPVSVLHVHSLKSIRVDHTIVA